MNLQIRDKFPLVDLATLGTKARRYVKPDVLIAGGIDKPFVQGDMLDANATFNLINEVLYGKSVHGVDTYKTLEEFQEALDKGDVISDAVVYFILDEGLIYVSGKYYQFGGLSEQIIEYVTEAVNQESQRAQSSEQGLLEEIENIRKTSNKTVILTLALYDALTKYEKNTIYFIIEGSAEGWTFGDKFPITFGSSWEFGNEFPINLN